MTTDVLDASPKTFLREMRGEIVDAKLAYPDVLHVEIQKPHGEIWKLATQYAEFSPADPADLIGKEIDEAQIDPITIELRCKLSNGTELIITPGTDEAEDDPPNWELLTPHGTVLEFGPGLRWQIGRSD
jgi:hypothetical protein